MDGPANGKKKAQKMNTPVDPRMIGALCSIKMAYEASFITAENALSLCNTILDAHGERYTMLPSTQTALLTDYMLFIDRTIKRLSMRRDKHSL